MKMCKQIVAAIVLAALATVVRAAQPVTVTVPGTSDPWLAGMPAGSSDSSDSAPAQSPVQVSNVILAPASQLVITATGGVSQTAPSSTFPLVSPDGTTYPFGPATHVAVNGIAAAAPTPFSALVGVFLDGSQPDSTVAPPAVADPTHPGLKQVFLIGSSAAVTVPAGATRLFLGVMDSLGGQYNNQGSFTAQIVTRDFSACSLYDSGKAAHAGSTIPIKLELCDTAGNNLSSAAIIVHAVSVTQVSNTAPGTLDDSGNANPDSDFRFDPTLGNGGGYIFNLSTKGLNSGTYSINFGTNADSYLYSTLFQVK